MFLCEVDISLLAEIFYKNGVIEIIPPPAKPRELASDVESRVFFNARVISQFPETCELVLGHFSQMIEGLKKPFFSNEKPDLVCSVPHGADHLAVLVGRELKLPVFQFEKEENGQFTLSGKNLKNLRRFENSTALVVDDVLTTGLSSGKVGDYLLKQGIGLAGLVCLVDRQRGGTKSLGKKGIKQVNCLMTMEAILQALIHKKTEFGKELPPIASKDGEEAVIREELDRIQKGGV